MAGGVKEPGLSYISDLNAASIARVAREDPFCTTGNWGFTVECDGVETYYAMQPNARPHARRADGLPIPKDGLRIPHHQDMYKVHWLARREAVLRSIEEEYGSLDNLEIWELVELPPGAKTFPIMLVIKVKFLPA